MAISVKVGTVALPNNTTGPISYTGVGFQPKALICSVNNRAAAGVSTAIAQIGFGFSDGTRSRACAFTSRNGGTTTENIDEEVRQAAQVITLLNTFGALHFEAALTSFDADGFTLNVSTATTGQSNLMTYLAIGGDDLTNVYVGDFLTGTSTGNVDVTDPGFAPDAVIMMHVNDGTALPNTSFDNGTQFGIGVGLSGSSRWGSVRTVLNQTLPTQAASQQESSGILYGLTTTNTQDFVADYSGTITGGFRINISDAPAATVRVMYLALKGGTYSCGLETQATSVTTKSTAVSGTPRGAFFAGTFLKTAAAGINTSIDAYSTFGATDGTNETNNSTRTADAVSTADVMCGLSVTKSLVKRDIAGTIVADADVTFTSGNMNVAWTTADATASQYGYLTIADASAAVTQRLLASTGVGK